MCDSIVNDDSFRKINMPILKLSLKLNTTPGDVQLLYFGNSPLRVLESAVKRLERTLIKARAQKKHGSVEPYDLEKKSYKITEDGCREAWSRSLANRCAFERDPFIFVNRFFHMWTFRRLLLECAFVCSPQRGFCRKSIFTRKSSELYTDERSRRTVKAPRRWDWGETTFMKCLEFNPTTPKVSNQYNYFFYIKFAKT